MAKYLLIILFFMTTQCIAKDNFASSSLKWVKDSLPTGTQIEFNKSKIKFTGCKHKEYTLTMRQPINSTLVLEGGLSYAKGRMNWGVNKQKISVKRYSIVPRIEVNEDVSIGAGVEYQDKPEFRSNFGDDFDLPASKTLLINSRFSGLRDNQSVELEFSSQRWEASNTAGNWFERGAADNKVTLSYNTSF